MPTFTYDQRLNNGAGGYRDSQTGRVVARAAVETAVYDFVQNSQDVSADLAGLLRDQRLSLADWQLQMREHIKDVHLAAAAAQKGGLDNMAPADYGRLGQRVRIQYSYLDRFAGQIADGSQPLDGRFVVRAKMYSEAAVQTFDRFQTHSYAAAGFDQERSVLEPGVAHCPECEAEASRGWQPIGDIIPIGERLCLTRCRCTKEFRNSQSQVTAV